MVRWSGLRELLLKRRLLVIGAASLVTLLTVVLIAKQLNLTWAEWTGFGADVEETHIQEVQPNGTVTKTTIAKKLQSQKTLWDWLSVLGVPLSLAILGFWLQQLQQKQASEFQRLQQEQADESQQLQREQASEEAKEEILQAYFDRISTLLIDKNVIAIAIRFEENLEYQAKHTNNFPQSVRNRIENEKELMNAAVDVIRARTLSILRRLGEDTERKGDVIRFLAETEIISRLKLNLSGVDLSGVNLWGANLSYAKLRSAKLSNANLRSANLIEADLRSADLSNAKLTGADLSRANLIEADFIKASLSEANFSGANLSYANLSYAILDINLLDANLESATYNNFTLFLSHIDPKARGMVKIESEPDQPTV